MATFLIRRLFQMLIVTIVAAILSYGLLYLVPGGPIDAILAERQNSGARRIDEDDIKRVQARFELDLALPVRFSRWLIGWPSGPLFGSLGADWVVGCATPQQVKLTYPDGRVEFITEGCADTVTLAELEGRKVSRGVFFGDFGVSQVILRDRPVTDLIMTRLPYTLYLMSASVLLAILIGVPIGVYSAVKQYSRFDYIMTTVAFIGASLPSFVFGIFAILIFSILAKQAGLPFLPSGDAVGTRDIVIPLIGNVEAGSFLDRFLRFLMPCTVLTFISLAGWSRFVRGSMLEVLQQDYVRTARAKGLRDQVVVLRHALRNAMIPVATTIGITFGSLLSGAVLTETIFAWPGLGRYATASAVSLDFPAVMGVALVAAIVYPLVNMLVDIGYHALDPRIQLE